MVGEISKRSKERCESSLMVEIWLELGKGRRIISKDMFSSVGKKGAGECRVASVTYTTMT